ncbi:uncharacterized mitochondrial protein AtMg00810 [Gossypium hirsutum]|uniref:Uncharacterized mitochondrial protein AtMg00810 n=1 Tax=Gossypium hirsutum TaxID=3635 RepID=A0A1U8NFP1_GOSHI|nr:uncharacterized mitochondrial protein AtMg00810-like [Gossypium hirsutum]
MLYVLVYVDDIIITGTHQANIDQFVTALNSQFSLKDLGPLSYFLGIEVSPTSNGLILSQRKYVLDLLRRVKMDQANGSPTLMIIPSILSQHTGCAIDNASEYRSIVGALQYVVIIRPDITFAVNKVCQFIHRQLDQHFKAVKRILRYLQGTLDYGIRFSAASFLDMKKQPVVSRSTAEVEYRALAYVVTEVVWLESLLSELHVSPSRKTSLWCDNSEQVADMFTKPLSAPLFTKFRTCLKVVPKG